MSYEGTVVLNYKLTKKLGEGGFGAVYLAEHADLGRQVACKILHPQYSRDPSIVERFFREAKAVTAIGHKAIVSIENFGTLPAGEPFYLMEFFSGSSLDELAGKHRLTSAQLIAIFDPIADALTAAHGRSIIHRDLKPDNIMVRMEGGRVADVRLLDFGIAKLMDGESYSMTGGAMGTPAFMAPEQALDAKHIDERADVYAFGATLYAAIAGRPPFSGATAAAILVRAQMDTAEPLTLLRAGVSDELAAIVDRCLAKQPADRPQTIAQAWSELREALSRARLDESVTTTPHAATIVAPSTNLGPTQIPATVPEPYPAGRRSRAPLLAALGLAVAGIVTAAIVLATRGGADSPSAIDAGRLVVVADAAVIEIDAAIVVDAAVATAPPMDAAEAPVDAELPVDAAVADARKTTPKVQPKPACTEDSFRAVIASGTEAQVHAALTRLKGCKDKLDASAFTRVQQALVGKL
ncbi:MAG: serine/threonine-protein kinase [Kofleriaceae bacterium]